MDDEWCTNKHAISSFIVFDAYHFMELIGKQMELHAIQSTHY